MGDALAALTAAGWRRDRRPAVPPLLIARNVAARSFCDQSLAGREGFSVIEKYCGHVRLCREILGVHFGQHIDIAARQYKSLVRQPIAGAIRAPRAAGCRISRRAVSSPMTVPGTPTAR